MKKMDFRENGPGKGPPVEGRAGWEKTALLRAREEIPGFSDAEGGCECRCFLRFSDERWFLCLGPW